eukprot:TRINITY_DN30079_c0_g1_i1.p1 TRINITY_DN30079_c0_g1~~TRINITY_DN30079_c0_g1_i1.p1  ORF type:complete len:478 (-),score=36.08 TRINITY_DN30079_c0_g1_i1:46-1479(-)
MTKDLTHTDDEVAKGSKCYGVADGRTYYAASFGYWFTDIKGSDVWPKRTLFDASGKRITASAVEKTHRGKCVIFEMCHNNANKAIDFKHTTPEPRIVELPAGCKSDSQIQLECIAPYFKKASANVLQGSNESKCLLLKAEQRRQHALAKILEIQWRYLNKTNYEGRYLGYMPKRLHDCPTRRGLWAPVLQPDYSNGGAMQVHQFSCWKSVRPCCNETQEQADVCFDAFKTIKALDKEAASVQEAVDSALSAWRKDERMCDNVFEPMWNAVLKCVQGKYAGSCDEACLSTSAKEGSGVVEGFRPDGSTHFGVKPLYLPPKSWMKTPWKDESWSNDGARIERLKEHQPRRYSQAAVLYGWLSSEWSGWYVECFALLPGDDVHSAMMLTYDVHGVDYMMGGYCDAGSVASAELKETQRLWDQKKNVSTWRGDHNEDCFTIHLAVGDWKLCIPEVLMQTTNTPQVAVWTKTIQETLVVPRP